MRLRLLASVLALAAGVVSVVVVALLLAPIAKADGDPASDWLLGKSAFVPPDAGISSADQASLTTLLQSAKAGGYPLRVAIIASQYDMGSVTVLWKRPKDYAPFLSEELRFLYKKRILVVMPNGFAIANDGKRDAAGQAVVGKLVPPKPFQGALLAAAVENAVRKLATAQGIVLPKVKLSAGGGSSPNRDRFTIAAVAVIIAVAAIAFSWWRRRGRSAPGRSP